MEPLKQCYLNIWCICHIFFHTHWYHNIKAKQTCGQVSLRPCVVSDMWQNSSGWKCVVARCLGINFEGVKVIFWVCFSTVLKSVFTKILLLFNFDLYISKKLGYVLEPNELILSHTCHQSWWNNSFFSSQCWLSLCCQAKSVQVIYLYGVKFSKLPAQFNPFQDNLALEIVKFILSLSHPEMTLPRVPFITKWCY